MRIQKYSVAALDLRFLGSRALIYINVKNRIRIKLKSQIRIRITVKSHRLNPELSKPLEP
jgi:hypothetical protein